MSANEDQTPRTTPIVTIALVVLAFVVGVLWQKVNYLEGGSAVRGATTTADTTGTTGNTNTAPSQPSAPAAGKLTDDQLKGFVPVNDSDHILGGRDSQVYLIEYSDFQCPYCQRFHGVTKQILDAYEGQVSLVYRHFPLDQIHPQARPAALASECIANIAGQDAFWQFADSVFEDSMTQGNKLADLTSLATAVGANASNFNHCLEDKQFEDVVNADYQSGLAVGVTGTPGNLIVNQKGEVWLVPGALPFEQMKLAIDEALSS